MLHAERNHIRDFDVVVFIFSNCHAILSVTTVRIVRIPVRRATGGKSLRVRSIVDLDSYDCYKMMVRPMRLHRDREISPSCTLTEKLYLD